MAVDIAPGRVAVARVERRGGQAGRSPAHAVEALPAGAVSAVAGGAEHARRRRRWPRPSARALAAAGARGRPRGCWSCPTRWRRCRMRPVREGAGARRRPRRADPLAGARRRRRSRSTRRSSSFTPGAAPPTAAHEFVVTRRAARRRRSSTSRRARWPARTPASSTWRPSASSTRAAPAGRRAQGDWLLVHVAGTYVTLAVMRDGTLIFYPQPRRGVGGHARRPGAPDGDVLRGSAARAAASRACCWPAASTRGRRRAASAASCRSGSASTSRRWIRSARRALADRIGASPALVDALAPLASGMLLRERKAA